MWTSFNPILYSLGLSIHLEEEAEEREEGQELKGAVEVH